MLGSCQLVQTDCRRARSSGAQQLYGTEPYQTSRHHSPWAGNHHWRLQKIHFCVQKMKENTGVGMNNVNRGIVDFGVQECFPSDAILKVKEPFTPEPPQLTTKGPRRVRTSIPTNFSRRIHEPWDRQEGALQLFNIEDRHEPIQGSIRMDIAGPPQQIE
jgi:hypothetical protein